MQQLPHAYSGQEPAQPERVTNLTTLGELIKAVSEEIETEEDHLAAEVVLQLLETGRIKFLNPKGKITLIWPIWSFMSSFADCQTFFSVQTLESF